MLAGCAGCIDGYAMRGTPVTSAQVWKAWDHGKDSVHEFTQAQRVRAGASARGPDPIAL